MNPKHFHTPVSTRLRCPVCHQPVYSRGGIHPQCAMRQSEPALHEPEEPEVSSSAWRAGRCRGCGHRRESQNAEPEAGDRVGRCQGRPLNPLLIRRHPDAMGAGRVAPHAIAPVESPWRRT